MSDTAPADPAARSGRKAALAIAGIIALGVALRLLTVRAQGFPSDVGTFVAWAEKLGAVGPGRFYEPGYFSDYPPGFLYILWGLGSLFHGDALRFAVKAISIPADIGIVLLLAWVLRRQVSNAAAVLAAGIWMLQPAPIFAGPYWGQVDAVGTLPFMGALVAAGSRRWLLAGVLAGVATMTKPQFGLVLGVVIVAVAFEFIRNADHRPALAAIGGAAATLVALAVPFGVTVPSFVSLVRSASETYPYSSLYAFNGWSVLLDFWKPDDPWFVPGGILLAAGLLASVMPLWWRRDTAALLAVGAAAAMAFYFLPTRAHERYLFPAIALLVPLAVTRARLLVPYLVLAGAFFLSLYFAFTRYPQNDLHAPEWLDATLFGRSGQIALALVMLGTAGLIAWRLAHGEARFTSTLALELSDPVPDAVERPRWSLPSGFGVGGPATRRDILIAVLVGICVLASRGYRLDHPRDMYFDEVYHARTAMELLAERDPYEWTHPHLAKEIMALGLMAFGGDRMAGSEGGPARVAAFAVSNDGTRVYGSADGRIELRDRDGRDPRSLTVLLSAPIAVAIDGDRLYAVTKDAVVELPFDAATRAAHRDTPLPALASHPLPARGTVNGLGIVGGRLVVTADAATSIFADAGSEPVVVPTGAVAMTGKADGTELYLVDATGAVHVVDPITGSETKMFPTVAKARAIAYSQGPHTLVLARSDEPVLDLIQLEDGHRDTVPLGNARTGTFTTGVTALADIPRTDFVYAIADGRVIVIDPHGGSPFAAFATAGTMLGVDGTADALLVPGPTGTVDRVDTGRHALAWRLPGVVAAALEAFFLVLLASRLFRSRLVPVLVGIAVLVDGSMFAQARIGMNDSFVGLFIVAGWYFIVAAHRPRRSAAVDLLIAGVLLGLGAASKWAAFYTLAGVFVAAVAVTAYAYERGRPGGGGPLDLLAGRGRNAALLFLSFAVVPVAIYVDSYVHWFGGQTAPYGWNLIELTQQMYWYHSGLTSPHPAASPWWSWPIVLKPVYWYFAQSEGGQNAYIYDAGNITLFWGALVATVWCGIAAVRARSVPLGFVVFALLVQYVAWIPISRVLFFYHFYTALPFYLLALACGLAYLWETARARYVVGYLALAAATFVYFYPFISGQPVPGAQASMFFILPTWQYDCQFYPSFVCPIAVPGDVPVVAVIGRIAGAIAVAVVVAALVLAGRTPGRARAIVRSALGGRGRSSADGG